MELISRQEHWAVMIFVVRVILGLLFFFQGYDKVFRLKMPGVTSYFKQELGNRQLPGTLITASAWFTSYVELIAGGLLILGLFKTVALYLLGIDLILVVGAFSLINPVWNMGLVFPRLILWAILMYFPESLDAISLDNLFDQD